jgi:hypothetical protein
VPLEVIKAKCAPYCKLGKPEARTHLVNNDDHTIVATYGAQYRGLINYYLLAGDVWRLNRVRWIMQNSLLKTLACKYGSTVSKMAARYKTTITTPHGPRTCLQATVERTGRTPLTTTFGGIPLKRHATRSSPTVNHARASPAAQSSSNGFRQVDARCASTPARWKPTTSPSSPTSANPGSHSRDGPNSWHESAERPS